MDDLKTPVTIETITHDRPPEVSHKYTTTDGNTYRDMTCAKRHQRELEAAEIVKGLERGQENWVLVRTEEEALAEWRVRSKGNEYHGELPHTYPAWLKIINAYETEDRRGREVFKSDEVILTEEDLQQLLGLMRGLEWWESI